MSEINEPKEMKLEQVQEKSTPATPEKVEELATKVEENEIDLTEAILKAYKQGRNDEIESQKNKSESPRKTCWLCGDEHTCVYCR